MSRWKYGCGTQITVYVPRGYTYREMKVECGSTAHDGGVNQCGKCANEIRTPPVPDEGDIEHTDDYVDHSYWEGRS